MIHRIVSCFVKITGFIPYLFVFRTKVYYQNRKAQSRRIKGKAIIVSNHTSVWDFVLVLFLFPLRLVRCVVAEIMYKKFGLNLLLPLIGSIKVDRNTQDYSFVSKSVNVLNKGGVIEIYPEGRIPEKTEEKPLPFKPSTVYVALESGAPIIPIYTNGKYFTKARARVIIGEPFYALDLYDNSLSEKENIEAINEHLRNKIIMLGEELERQTNQKN
ncbi:MAG: 1-acyl-sn-glycerol-3-phosphate acyltransferase [Clostridia bacterium]|nr:1-acyl-sn-glycerol-3-phosphate acyltransferase [Clostridia bacterium]